MDKRDLERMTQIEAYAVKVLSEDQTGHSMDHINRVVKNARNIQEIEGGDLFLILSGAYLHDVMDDKLVENPQKAREELKKLLISLELEEKVVEHLFEIIDNVSFSYQLEQKEPPKLSLEAKIVQDADRLDAIGAIGIGRTFYYGGKKGHTLYDSTIPPRDNMTKEDYRINQTVINHFYEKLFKLPDLMQTTTGKKLAYDRKDLMVNFVNAFMEELE